MTLRKWAPMLALITVLSGCRAVDPPAERPAAAPAGAGSDSTPRHTGMPEPASKPTEQPSQTEPHSADESCLGPVTGGGPRVYLAVSGVKIELPPSDCRLRISAGTMSLTVRPDTYFQGKREAEKHLVDLSISPGDTRKVTIDLGTGGGARSVTYTLVGEAPASEILSSAPDRRGPWTGVPPSGLVPADHGWLRVSYPRPMPPGQAAPVTPDQYVRSGPGLDATWDGDRTQYVDISALAPVLFMINAPARDADGLVIRWTAPRVLYRGEPPQVQAITAADGSARKIYSFTEVPAHLSFREGVIGFHRPANENSTPPSLQIDLSTGQVSPGTGDSSTLAEQSGKGLGYEQFRHQVLWSPSGRHIVFGTQVVEASSGHVVAQGVLDRSIWSPDSRYLLLFQPDYPFTIWGVLGLLDVTTDSRRTLGHGLGLGWTSNGEALVVRWDVSRHIPAPAKDCL